ncbi:Nuclear distribution protein nudE-like 1 [Orchesella cincta]|uniref:Nuclear distribution protein nudE-like 1 n=1 Tax=Orchesella cincta TaxID=48709 RepID=A0A1D2NMH2_ORCCI|nr:Nuclear distribution protein nudE-like 1 [Orchesella cincta]
MEDEDFDMTNVPNFTSPQEEAEFWKKKALACRKGLDELKKDFEEYQEDSKTLEVELDTQIKLTEQKNKDLTACISRIQNDNENLRSRLEQMNAEHNARMAEWSAEVTSFRKTGDEINTYVRELEQKNDDLERANRAAAMSIEDFEVKLNLAIERNAFLESELDEKENLKSMVQRLKDETRDLRYELQFTKRQSDKVVDSNKLEATPPSTPPYNLAKTHQANLSTPTSSRMSPLSIVNDLLRKVGALETKLQTYHKKDEANIKKLGRSVDSKNHQNKAHKLPRGVSSPAVQEIIKT